MVHFREVQQFRQPWLWIPLLVGVPFFIWLIVRQAGSTPGVLVGPCVYLAIVALFFLAKLVTEVDDTEVRTRFVFLFGKKQIPFAQIAAAEAVTYRPIREYGGWGLRRGANGWAFNVSGNRGVLLKLRAGGTFLIGSQRAEELEQAIRARLNTSS
jgi:hypothetical protein